MAVVAAALFVLAPPAMPATPGLVAAYGFEEGSGSTVTDASGTGNNGTLTNATWTTSGRYGNALRFDGSSASVRIPDAASLHLTTGMTLEAWVDPAVVVSTWQDVIFKGDDNYYLEATSPFGDRPTIGSVFDGIYGEAFGPTTLPANTWSHLAATYDGSTLRLYVNGTEVASTPKSSSLATSTNPLQIGGDLFYGQYFQGLIDEVRVYRVARTASEIQSDMATPVVQTSTPAPDTEAPSEPGTLTATATSSSRIDLAWGPASDNVGVSSYKVERCQGAGCTNFVLLDATAGLSYSDTTTTPAWTTYSYRVLAADAAGNRGPYSNTATATTPAATVAAVGPGPITVGPTGRYLVDQNGAPFLITGESPQALIGNLTESDAALFFANRRAHGFNAVWINLLCNSATACRADGSTWDGIPPFTTPGDFSTPNEAYFAHVDRIIRLAGQYGLVVILDPAETAGWLTTMVGNGVDKVRAFGRYLGGRYKDFPNIIWMSGNDYQNWGPVYDPYVTALALGIRDVDTRHIHTIELNYLISSSLDDPTWAPIISLNASYTYYPTYQQVLKDYNRSNFLPTFLVEASYEFEGGVTIPAGTPLQLRRQEYWSLLSGATGQLYGNKYTWQFICPGRDSSGNCMGGWKDQLDTPGAIQMANVKALFAPRRWYDLVPDQGHRLVTGGYGTWGSADYVTAARTPDGSLAMAYLPTKSAITVDLSTLSGTVNARWYDPTTGTFTSIGQFGNVGSQHFVSPSNNAAGDPDWVLVLEGS